MKLLERKIRLKGMEVGGDIQDYSNMLRRRIVRFSVWILVRFYVK